MKGRVIEISDINLKFGKESRYANVYACFKYQTNGNQYIIFRHSDDKENKINLGSMHIKENNDLVTLDVNEQELDILKEYIEKLTHDEEMKKYQMIDFSKVNKLEIIAESSLPFENKIIKKVEDMVIPKPEETSEEKPKKKKGSWIWLVLGLLLAGAGIAFIFFRDSVLPPQKVLSCVKEYKHDKLDVNVTEEIILKFGNQNKVESGDKTIVFKFDDSSDYFDFKEDNEFYKYAEDDSSYKFIDEDMIFKQFIDLDKKVLPETYDESMLSYSALEYNCTEVSDNE